MSQQPVPGIFLTPGQSMCQSAGVFLAHKTGTYFRHHLPDHGAHDGFFTGYVKIGQDMLMLMGHAHLTQPAGFDLPAANDQHDEVKTNLFERFHLARHVAIE